VRETVFKGQISKDDFDDAIGNSMFTYDITPEHIQVTTDTMVKTGVGRMARPPVAKDWVRTDLLAAAKQRLNVK
jgi:NitT/TauT family transport system substrate-binding protein